MITGAFGIEKESLAELLHEAALGKAQLGAYQGIYALLRREGARDLRTGEPSNVQNYFDERVDIHHLFRKAALLERIEEGLPGEPDDEPGDYEVLEGYDDLEGDAA